MPALRQPLKRPRLWICLLAAAVIAAAAISDWKRPPQKQLSVRAYEQVVVRPYRRFIHPVSSRFVQCRYQPSCSHYSVQAVQMYGFPNGIWLTTKRILRCMPWVPLGTYDPVPSKKPPQFSIAQHRRAENAQP